MTRISRIRAPRASFLAITLLALAILGVGALAGHDTSPAATAKTIPAIDLTRAERHPCGFRSELRR